LSSLQCWPFHNTKRGTNSYSSFYCDRGRCLILLCPFRRGRQNQLMEKIQSRSRMRNAFYSLYYCLATKFDTIFLFDWGDRSPFLDTQGWFCSWHQPLGQLVEFLSMYRWGIILIFGWARWPMKTILTRERLSDWTARYNASYRFLVADSKLL